MARVDFLWDKWLPYKRSVVYLKYLAIPKPGLLKAELFKRQAMETLLAMMRIYFKVLPCKS